MVGRKEEVQDPEQVVGWCAPVKVVGEVAAGWGHGWGEVGALAKVGLVAVGPGEGLMPEWLYLGSGMSQQEQLVFDIDGYGI